MKIYTVFLLCLASHHTSCCIEKYSTCGCRNSRDPKIRGKRLACRNINVADMFVNADFPKDILISVDLSENNNLQELSKETFGHNSHTLNILRDIKKLDFSQNVILKIAPETFTLFPNLTRLNLSSNSIGRLSPDMFIGLTKLKMLDLSRNIFPIFPGNVLTSLTSLKKLYLKSTELICNCLMQEFATRLKKSKSFLNVYGTCYLPLNWRGRSLTKLVPENMKCDANNTLDTLPHFEMIPSVPQLAFEGDTLKLHCEGTYLQTSKIVWSFNGSLLDFSKTSAFYVNATENFVKSVITGWLKIANLSQEHTGTWNCKVTSEYGSETRTVKIIVIKRAFVYCQQEKTENDRGSFLWPSTISGVTRTIECSEPQHTSGNPIFQAFRTCSAGNWSVANYDACPYADEVTEHVNGILKKDLLEVNTVTFLNMLLKNIIHKPLRYPLTVQLIGELMGKVVPLITDENQDKISIPLLKLASYVMLANETILEEAQKNTGACDKILEVVRCYALEMASSASFHKESQNIAIGGSMVLEKERYNEEGDGMNCKIIRSEENLEFACQTKTNGFGVQPSISFPRTLLDLCEDDNKGYRLYFIGYRNGSLFQPIPPDTKNESSASVTTGVTSNSMVLEVGIKGCGVVNLSDPITFTFETDAPGGYYAAVWSPQGWSESDDCSAQFIRRNITQVVCHNVATVTLIRDPNAEFCGKDTWFMTNLTHPATLVGTGVLAVCVFFVIMSYMCCYSKMRMSSNYRHMLFNICVHLLLASCTFALCIRRIDHRAVCITCGIILHYTSLAVLLWITLSVRNIHRELAIYNRPPSLEPKPQRPMLRFYLIGCGIPIVICAITVAAKVQNYGGDEEKVEKYCWLSWETSIYAFYSPAAFIAVVCIICLIRVLCAFNHYSSELDTPISPLVRSSWPGNTRIPNSSDQYQAIATEDASFRANVPPDNITNSPLHPAASFHGNRLNDLSFKTQLCGAALSFIFYLLTWVFAALSIAAPNVLFYQGQGLDALNYVEYSCLKESASKGASTAIEDVFAYAYAIMAMAMGIFILLQHLACRKDVRESWQNAFSCFKPERRCHQNPDIRTSSLRLEKSVTGELPADHVREYLTSSNGKSSNKNRRGICTTIKTDPTMETIVMHSGDAGRNGTVEESQHLQFHQETLPKSCPSNGSEYRADCVPYSFQESGRPAKSVTSLRMVKHSEDVPTASFRGHSHKMSSSGHRHIPLSCSHNPYVGLNARGGYVPDPHSFQHHGYPNAHLQHQQHTKPVKLTNLHMAHDSSMTEYSLDEMAHNNMHTIPVIMQHHTQRKVNNSALVDRYQKVWRALERKRAKQKRLDVLREYAQDPLTSNDEGQRDEKVNSVNEASLLLQSPEKTSPYSDTKGIINGALKYRPLLLLPSHKKQDGLKSKNTGPTKRVKRLDSSGQPRPLRGDKRAKQNSRISRNSTLSERERDTTSSEKSGDQIEDISKISLSIPSKNALSVTKHNFDSQTTTVAGNDNHCYLTLQQLQNANPFLFCNQGTTKMETESSPPSPESMLENFVKPNQTISHTSLDNSQVLSHRNETSV